MMEKERVISLLKRESLLRLVEQGKRVDGRTPTQYRPLSVEVGTIKSAEGSALVRLGETAVLVGVKPKKMPPFPDSPDEGALIVGAELRPLASPTFEPGPPDENSIELSRVVDRGLRESKCLDFRELCVEPGKEVWVIYVDIHVLDHAGNLIDASMLASVAALLNMKGVDDPAWKKDFSLKHKPVSVTVAKLGNSLLADPSLEEEEAMDSRITFCIREDGVISAIQKGGSGFLEKEEVLRAEELAFSCAEELRKVLG
ncbi:MAG: exosome complex protein Rrp42 [Candidatus Hadarchaeales archaeon]